MLTAERSFGPDDLLFPATEAEFASSRATVS
jgi:hypothetical protein